MTTPYSSPLSPLRDASGSRPPAQRRTPVQGERRFVTVLFCDVQGSTSMAERLDPEDWAEIMNEAFDYLIGPVYRYEGTVARLLGDGLLAFFGAPLAHEDDPTRGVLAALEILENIAAFRPTVQHEYGLDFNVRVGLNTGIVVVGEIGADPTSGQLGEYTALGDAVNVAARMEQTAVPGTVQIAEPTFHLIAPLFECEALGEIEVHGKSEPVPTYRVLRRKRQTPWGAGTRSRGWGGAGRRVPMIGREAEANALYEVVQAAAAGQGGIVFLTGEAGLGKTRLIEEVRARMEKQPAPPRNADAYAGGESSDPPGGAPIWFSARGISYDMNRPYGLFRQFFYQACALQESDAFDAVAARIDEAFADASDDQRALYRRGLGYLFDPESTAAPGELVRREIAETATAMTEQVARRAPALIVLDDLHWADPATVELLTGVLGLTERHPLLFLCAMRPEQESAAWGLRSYAEQRHAAHVRCIELAPLSPEDAMALVGHLLQDSNLPDETRALILRRAEGNPYFVEEVARMMLENQMPESDEGEAHDRTLAGDSAAIPPSLQALLTARIDRLENALRRTLQLAAVIGRNFSEDILCRLADMPDEIPGRLDALIEAQFLRPGQEPQEQRYTFVSELVRDAAYQSILFRARRQLHRRVAEAIEALDPDRIDEQADRLAYHFTEALDLGRAFAYAMRAAKRAARLYALHEAIGLYRKALDLARSAGETGSRGAFSPSGDQLVELYTDFGRVLELTGGHPEALRIYEELDALGQERNEPALRLAAALAQATVYSTYTTQFNAPRGVILGERALMLARQIGSVRDEARALWNLLLANMFGAIDLYRAMAYGEEGLALARANNLEEEVALILHDLQRAYAYVGRQAESMAALTEARALFRKLDNRPLLADNLTATAENLLVSAEISEALRLAEEGGELSHSVGNVWGEAYALYIQGLASLQQGEISRGLRCVERAVALGDQAQFTPPIETFIGYIGWIYQRLGALHLIEKQVREGIERANMSLTPQWQVQAVAAWFEFHMGKRDLDADYLDLVSAAIDTSSMRAGPDAIPIYAMLAEIRLRFGRQERVVEETLHLVDLLREAHVLLMVPLVLQVQGRALTELGRFEDARAALLEAAEMEVRSGSHANRLLIYESLIPIYERTGDETALAEARSSYALEVEYLSERILDPELHAAFLAHVGNAGRSDAPGV